MKNFKKIRAFLFLSAYFIISLSFISPALAELDVNFTPQISIPGSEFQQGVGVTVVETNGATTSSTLLARYIRAFYNYGLSIVGVLAVLMLMAGGFTWLTAADNSSKIGTAKKMIGGSLLGSFLLLGAYFFLNTINPDLTKLPAIEMGTINRVALGCCEVAKDDGTTKRTSNENCQSGFSETKFLDGNGKCTEPICCVITSPGHTIKYDCMTTTELNCRKYPSGVAEAKSCESISKCQGTKNLKMNCDGISNGDAPSGKGAYDEVYCYDGVVYSGRGNIGEPCGNETYSKCTDGYFDCTQDLGKRSCSTMSWCCKYNANGTKKE